MARLALVLVPGEALDPGALPGAGRTRLPLVHHAHPPEAAALTLLGQDPQRAWSGPAALAAAAGGRTLREGETAWLLDPVRVSSDGKAVLEGPLRVSAASLADALEHLAPDLPRVCEVVVGEPCALIDREALVGPSTAIPELLAGRGLETFWEGHPPLRDVILASARACREAGCAATHLVPHSPAGPLSVRPLREVWPWARSAAIVGASALARALAQVLDIVAVHVEPGDELAAAAAELDRRDVVVAHLSAPPTELSALDRAPVLVLASEPDAEGTVELAVRGAPPPTRATDPLGELVGRS